MSEICRQFEMNPLRPKNWRFALVQALLAQNIPIKESGLIDKLQQLAEMIVYLESFGPTGPSMMQYAMLAADYGPKYTAYSIYTDNRHTNARHMLEAMLVTDATNAAIAERLGYKEEIVDWFEYCFFDVRSRMATAGYVQQELLGTRFGQGISSGDTDIYWKALALAGGLPLLEIVWGGSALTEKQILAIRKALQSRLYTDSLKAMHVRRPAEHNASEILNDLVTVNKELAPRVGVENELEEAAKDIIESVKPGQRSWDAPYSGYEATLYANQEQEELNAPDGFIRSAEGPGVKPSSP